MVRTLTCPPLGWKPGAEAVSFQLPARRPMIENRPLSSVVAVNEGGDAAGFSATTVAPLTGSPFSSFTTPPTRPVWAATGSAPSSSDHQGRERPASDFHASLSISQMLKLPETFGLYASGPGQASGRTSIGPVPMPFRATLSVFDSWPASWPQSVAAQPVPDGGGGGLRSAPPRRIGALVEQAIADRLTPGAVVVVGRGDTRGLREGLRPARRGPGARADVARHHLRPGVADQGGGHDDGDHAAGGGRARCG